MYRPDSLTVEVLAALPYFKCFWKTYNFLQRSQWWNQDQLESYQLKELCKLLNHAYINVPYYKKLFDKQGLKPKEILKSEDLNRIPFLTKEIVRENQDNLKARNYPKNKFRYLTTGGSTGIPLGFCVEKGVWLAKELAYTKTLLNRIGCDFFKDKFAYLRGNVVQSTDKDKFWHYSLFGRCLVLSSFHMSEKNLPNYIEKIRKFQPKFIMVYPSAIVILARFMKKNNIEPIHGIKAIICGAENLYDWQRNLLEETFPCKIFDWYGHAEQAVLAGGCEKSNYYHIFPEYGTVELVNKDGKPVTRENEMGEIVATGFKNYIFPFIRYKTGDFGIHTAQKCECGRNYPLLKKIEGRLQEFIVANDSSLIPFGPVIGGGMHEYYWSKIRDIQFLQEKPGELLICVVKGSTESEASIKKYVLRIFKERLKDRCKLIVRFVDQIPRTQSGKYMYLIQKLQKNLCELYG